MGEFGRQVVRYEWTHYKMILQTGRDPWTPVRIGNRAFFDKVYRMNEKSLEDWSPIFSKPGLVETVLPAAQHTTEEMVMEYLNYVFKPLVFDTVPESQGVPGHP